MPALFTLSFLRLCL